MAAIDPVLGMRYSKLFLFTGAMELAMSCFLWVARSDFAAIVLEWAATVFGLYHWAAAGVGVSGCPCLGSALQWLGLTGEQGVGLSRALTVYFFVGSCGILLVRAKDARRPAP